MEVFSVRIFLYLEMGQECVSLFVCLCNMEVFLIPIFFVFGGGERVCSEVQGDETSVGLMKS